MSRREHFICLIALLLCAAGQVQANESGMVQRCIQKLGLTAPQCRLWVATALPDVPVTLDAVEQARAFFGRRLFFEPGLSPAGVQCVSCHVPEKGYSDGRAVSVGIRAVTRNSPSLLNVAYFNEFFWDGRARWLWEQPLITLLHPDEMAADPLAVAHFLYSTLKTEYESNFGPLPPLADRKRFPLRGSPGQKDFLQMAQSDQDAVLEIFRNVGRAFAAYVTRLQGGPARVDRFLKGELSDLTAQEKRGMQIITKVGCLNCHSGTGFTDGRYHNIRISAEQSDQGRYAGLEQRNSFLNRSLRGDLSPEPSPAALIAQMRGAFRTPSLRNLMRTAPYFHDGSAATLGEAVRRHNPAGTPDSKVLTERELSSLVAFLRALEGAAPRPPWGGWPYR